MGLSAKPAGGYNKKTQGGDIAGILDHLGIERGVGPWEEILKNPLLWHFRFGGPIWSG
jgi:hypothetical protein